MREKIYAVARFGKEGKSDAIIPKLGQEVLAENGPIYIMVVSTAQFPPQYRPPRLKGS